MFVVSAMLSPGRTATGERTKSSDHRVEIGIDLCSTDGVRNFCQYHHCEEFSK